VLAAAAKRLIDASKGGSVEAVADQLTMALLLDGTLDVAATVQARFN
jgi:hypothetical protein